MIQRRLAWPLCEDDMQIHEAFHKSKKEKKNKRVKTHPIELWILTTHITDKGTWNFHTVLVGV